MPRRILFCLFVLLAATVAARAQDPPPLFVGQVVCCEECWAEADRTRVPYGTAEDLLRAGGCVAAGDPTLLAVREGDRFTFYQLEPGRFRLPGKDWLEFVGRHVAVTGVVQKRGDASILSVDDLEVLAPSLAEQAASTVIGREVELILKDPFGTEQRLSALKGRIVVLNFWATYCAPCRREMPDLAAIQNEYAALGVQVVGASADAAEDREKVLQFVKETKVNFPIWMGATTSDMMRFGLGAALPGTVVIGRDGKVARVISGVVQRDDLKRQIDAMLVMAAKERAAEQERAGEVSSVPS